MKHHQVFLDIETTGFSRSNDYITTVVWFGDGVWGRWVNDGMSPAHLIADWNNSDELITFNGRTFDEPWLTAALGVRRHPNHIDLKDETAARGLGGGLKKVTERLSIPRPAELDKIEGKHAVKLWRSSRKGNNHSLSNLLYYNAWDVVLTYGLYCLFQGTGRDPIEETIPFTPSIDALRPFLDTEPNGGAPPTARRSTNGIPVKELWKQRRHSPLRRIDNALVCFTGDLERCEREEATALVSSLGGIVKKSSVQCLDFLVVGNTGQNGKTKKIIQAEEYIGRGAHTRIIREQDFFELVRQTEEQRTA